MSGTSLKTIVLVQFLISLLIYSLDVGQYLYLVQAVLTTFMIYLMFSGLRSPFYIIISAFFILGNWFKLSVHKVLEYPYVEPNGGFISTDLNWGLYYKHSISITVGFILFKLVMDISPKKKTQLGFTRNELYISNVNFFSYVFVVLVLYLLNAMFGFFRIGVERSLHLPFGLDAPVTFLVFMGAPLLLAYAVTRKCIKERSLNNRMIFFLVVMSIFASVTIYSRSFSLIILIPIFLGVNKTLSLFDVKVDSGKIVFYVVLSLISSITIVSALRIITYGAEGYITAEQVEWYVIETLGLFADRWIGVEAIMTSVMSNGSWDLFIKMITESPGVGVDGIYQTLSGSHYVALDKMTFLTLPGLFGIISFSGSYLVIVLCVMMMLALGCMVERFVELTFDSFFAVQYLVSTNMAYHYSQMVYPRLFIPFILQLLVVIAIFSLYHRWVRTRAGSHYDLDRLTHTDRTSF